MAKPLPIPAPVQLISWHVSLSGDEFDVEGVSVVEALKLFNAWNDKRGGSGLTPAQLSDILARAEKLAARLEGIDAQN